MLTENLWGSPGKFWEIPRGLRKSGSPSVCWKPLSLNFCQIVCTRFENISEPHPNHIRTTSEPRPDHIRTTSGPHPNHIRTASEPHPKQWQKLRKKWFLAPQRYTHTHTQRYTHTHTHPARANGLHFKLCLKHACSSSVLRRNWSQLGEWGCDEAQISEESPCSWYRTRHAVNEA